MFKTEFMHNLHFTTDDPPVKGFQEAVFSVSNLERSIDFYQRVCGWELVGRHSGNEALKHLWHLDPEVEIEEALLRNPGDKEGFLRVVKFKNIAQEQIRSAARAWDTGGIFDINIRARNVDSLYRDFECEGWNGHSSPLRYTFGQFDVSEVLVKGPDGVTIALIQRFAPPLEGFPNLEVTSHIFNSSIISRDCEATYDFFVNKLGFKVYMEVAGADRKAGPNVLGIPPNINNQITVPVYIVRPDSNAFGSIEFLELKELEGRDCSALAKPPNLGILMLRFPVANARSYAETLQQRGVVLNSEVQDLVVEPYGPMHVFSVISPDGAWIEFMEIEKQSF